MTNHFPYESGKGTKELTLRWQVLGSPLTIGKRSSGSTSTNPLHWALGPFSSKCTKRSQTGVISANSRIILREGGVMGVLLEDLNMSTSGIPITEVLPHSSGDRAGLKIGDRILKSMGVR